MHHWRNKCESRNANFISIARKGDTTTLGPKGRRPFLHNPPTKSAITLGPQAPSTFPFEPFEPSEPEPRSGPYPISQPTKKHPAGGGMWYNVTRHRD